MGFSAAPIVQVEPRPVVALLTRPRAEAGEILPPEISFLSGTVPETTLFEAARRAQASGVTAEAVLLAEGSVSSETYYRALAATLFLPYAERPVRPESSAGSADVIESGIVALHANPDGWRFLAAPRGDVLLRLMRLLGSRNRHHPPVMAIASPERFEALIRHDRRKHVLKTATDALPDWNHALSARSGITPGQSLALFVAAGGFCAAAFFAPALVLLATELVFTAAFLLVVLLRLLATAASPRPRSGKAPERASDVDLPVYTVIVPLFREARVVRQLTVALDRLDYPAAKLDVVLVVEASDTATLEAIERLQLPARYRTIIAPPGRPRTKPRALNIALQFARGRFVVIYDAEDVPEPGQLRAAARLFAADPTLACLQARLAIDNIDDSWLTALFALEYAALFHVVNSGLAALGLPIPLGGTSNHFRIEVLRAVNGWDAWNVTEDIDLGIRLARFGHRVGSLESTTYEEAPNTLDAWLKQRCRWMKGWMVTLGTHSRAPGRLWHDLGTVSTLAVAAMLVGTVASCLLAPFCALMLLLRACTGSLFWTRTPLDVYWNAASAGLVVLGGLSAFWPVIIGLRRRKLLGMSRWLGLFPVYMVLLSIAAWQAAFEVFGRPHSWTKTEHGRAKQRLGTSLPG